MIGCILLATAIALLMILVARLVQKSTSVSSFFDSYVRPATTLVSKSNSLKNRKDVNYTSISLKPVNEVDSNRKDGGLDVTLDKDTATSRSTGAITPNLPGGVSSDLDELYVFYGNDSEDALLSASEKDDPTFLLTFSADDLEFRAVCYAFPFLYQFNQFDSYHFSETLNQKVLSTPFIPESGHSLHSNPLLYLLDFCNYVHKFDSTGGLSETQFLNTLESTVPSKVWNDEKVAAAPTSLKIAALMSKCYTMDMRARDYQEFLCNINLQDRYADEHMRLFLKMWRSPIGRMELDMMRVSKDFRENIMTQLPDLFDKTTGLLSDEIRALGRQAKQNKKAQDRLSMKYSSFRQTFRYLSYKHMYTGAAVFASKKLKEPSPSPLGSFSSLQKLTNIVRDPSVKQGNDIDMKDMKNTKRMSMLSSISAVSNNSIYTLNSTSYSYPDSHLHQQPHLFGGPLTTTFTSSSPPPSPPRHPPSELFNQSPRFDPHQYENDMFEGKFDNDHSPSPLMRGNSRTSTISNSSDISNTSDILNTSTISKPQDTFKLFDPKTFESGRFGESRYPQAPIGRSFTRTSLARPISSISNSGNPAYMDAANSFGVNNLAASMPAISNALLSDTLSATGSTGFAPVVKTKPTVNDGLAIGMGFSNFQSGLSVNSSFESANTDSLKQSASAPNEPLSTLTSNKRESITSTGSMKSSSSSGKPYPHNTQSNRDSLNSINSLGSAFSNKIPKNPSASGSSSHRSSINSVSSIFSGNKSLSNSILSNRNSLNSPSNKSISSKSLKHVGNRNSFNSVSSNNSFNSIPSSNFSSGMSSLSGGTDDTSNFIKPPRASASSISAAVVNPSSFVPESSRATVSNSTSNSSTTTTTPVKDEVTKSNEQDNGKKKESPASSSSSTTTTATATAREKDRRAKSKRVSYKFR